MSSEPTINRNIILEILCTVGKMRNKQGSNTVISTLFALKFLSNEMNDVDMTPSFTWLKVAHYILW